VYVHQPQFCTHFWVCGMPMCFVLCENSIDLYCMHSFSSWMVVHHPTDRSHFSHCNNTRRKISSLGNFLSEYLTMLFNSKELGILEDVEGKYGSLLEIFFHHLLKGGLGRRFQESYSNPELPLILRYRR